MFAPIRELDLDASLMICGAIDRDLEIGLPVWLNHKRIGKLVGCGPHSGVTVRLADAEATKLIGAGVIAGLAIDNEEIRLTDYDRRVMQKSFDIREGNMLRKGYLVNSKDRDFWGFDLTKTRRPTRNNLRALIHSL